MLSLLVRPPRNADARGRTGAAVAWQAQVREQMACGDLSIAERMLREALRSDPDCVEALRTLGSVLGASGRLDEARTTLERCLRIDPGNGAALADLGNVHRGAGRPDEAERCYRSCLAAHPDNRIVTLNLALLQADTGRIQAAIDNLERLLAAPAHPEALQSLVRLLDAAGRINEAREICSRVLQREPEHGAAHAALGFLLLKRYLEPQEALEHFDRALVAGFANEEVLSNRGIAYQDLGRLDEAIAGYEAALEARPEFHSARFHRALALLMRGEFDRAWADYDLRLQNQGVQTVFERLPAWRGEPLPANALVVYGEQGLGDEIMFASCMGDLHRRCPNIVLACSAKLEALFRRSFPQTSVVTLDQAAAAPGGWTGAKARAAIGSLPRYLRESPQQFPRHDGYLLAEPGLVAAYRSRLQALGPGLKVGVCWRGGTELSRRPLRTLNADALGALLEFPARFINLQYDSNGREPELSRTFACGKLVHWQDALDDYDRTAALVCALDIVVSVCSAVIHLAGGLGRPALVMTPFVPEWRYGVATESMPWYPSVRLVRQQSRGDWPGVIRRVHCALTELAESNSNS